ncbi:MAG: gamma-glutamylcyclotransferase [Chthoniobacterales bacterium]|nr:gamma-glutamylcyclotransferase [Chthoniobacterales bacterium]
MRSLTRPLSYGTVRRGGSNHFRMAGAEFVAPATARGRLYQIDWYPGLVLDDKAGEIIGDIYQVSAELMEALDAFEGAEYPASACWQRCWMVRNARHGFWEWLGAVAESRRITGGDWLDR